MGDLESNNLDNKHNSSWIAAYDTADAEQGVLLLLLSMMCGENTEADRKSQRGELNHICGGYNYFPWILIGDFNVCKFTHEKIRGKSLFYSKVERL